MLGTLDAAYDMNILQYLSDLVYIKEKQKNERAHGINVPLEPIRQVADEVEDEGEYK